MLAWAQGSDKHPHRDSRLALFGIPLQQTWSYANSGDFAPTYYLQTDAPLYYYMGARSPWISSSC